jgi:hypothetical protein
LEVYLDFGRSESEETEGTRGAQENEQMNKQKIITNRYREKIVIEESEK